MESDVVPQPSECNDEATRFPLGSTILSRAPALNLYQDSSGFGHALNTVGGCPASDPRGGRHRPCLSGCPVNRALFGAGDSQQRLNIDLANVFAAWTDTISSVTRPALGVECTVPSFGTLEALRSFSYLSCHGKVISLTFYDQRVPSWSELKLGVLGTQQQHFRILPYRGDPEIIGDVTYRPDIV